MPAQSVTRKSILSPKAPFRVLPSLSVTSCKVVYGRENSRVTAWSMQSELADLPRFLGLHVVGAASKHTYIRATARKMSPPGLSDTFAITRTRHAGRLLLLVSMRWQLPAENPRPKGAHRALPDYYEDTLIVRQRVKDSAKGGEIALPPHAPAWIAELCAGFVAMG